MNRDERTWVSGFLIVALLASVMGLPIGAIADPLDQPDHPEGPPKEDGGLVFSDPVLQLSEGLITDAQEIPPFLPGTTCDWAPASMRLTTPPSAGSTKRVAFVYVTPTTSDTSWTDSKLDLARLCTDGRAYSAVDYMYRNTARFMARELALDATIGSKRLYPFVNTYTWGFPQCGTVPPTCSASLYAGYYLKTTNTFQYLSDLLWNRKLDVIRTKLRDAGFSDPNVVYIAILDARQNKDDPATTDDDRYTDDTEPVNGFETLS